MTHVVEVLAPVFVMIALGAVLRRTRFVSAEALTVMNRLCYWVGLPCVLLRSLAGRTFEASAGLVLLVVVGGMLACLVVGAVVAWLRKMPGPRGSALVHTTWPWR